MQEEPIRHWSHQIYVRTLGYHATKHRLHLGGMQRNRLHRSQQTSKQEDGENHKGRSKRHSANAMHYFTTKYFSAMCKSLERWHEPPAHAKNHHFQFFSVEKASPSEEMRSSAMWFLSTILKYSLHLAAPSKTTTIFFVVTKKCDVLFFQWLQHKNQFFPITVCSAKMVRELRSCKLPFHH